MGQQRMGGASDISNLKVNTEMPAVVGSVEGVLAGTRNEIIRGTSTEIKTSIRELYNMRPSSMLAAKTMTIPERKPL